LQAILEAAHAREILLDPVAILRAELLLQSFRLHRDGVEDAACVVQFLDLRGDPGLGALEEKLLVDFRRFVLRWHGDAGARGRKTAGATVDRERQRGKTPDHADALGDHLIKRDRVAEAAAARMWRRR
jgi:hypothetical protein